MGWVRWGGDQVGGGGGEVQVGKGGSAGGGGGGGVGTVGDGGWVQVEDGLGSGGEVWLVHMGGGSCSGGGGGLSWKRGLRGRGVLSGGRGLMGGGVLSVGGGGEINGIFLQIEFRFRNGLGRTVALQSFGITCLINAEIFANFSTTRETTIKWKKSILM